MILFMTGTPGSGKSYSMAHKIKESLHQEKNVISTVQINLNKITNNGKRKIGVFEYIPIFELTPEKLYRFAVKNHIKGKEKQTLVFIDECQLIFNTREYSKSNRMPWIEFFSTHRHMGFDIYLITQNDRTIDRQIRSLVEHEVKHKKINNRLWFLPVTIFTAVELWYCHTNKIKISSKFILFRRSVSKIYDSYVVFDKYTEKYSEETSTEPAESDTQPEETTAEPTEEIATNDHEEGPSQTDTAGGDTGAPPPGRFGLGMPGESRGTKLWAKMSMFLKGIVLPLRNFCRLSQNNIRANKSGNRRV